MTAHACELDDLLAAAKRAAGELAPTSGDERDVALAAIADALETHAEAICAANERDVRIATERGMSTGLIDRLRLDHDRVGAIAQAVREIVALPDPVGEVTQGRRLANGLEATQVRVPLGVVAMIYEARPNVTVDAAALALKAGNAVILRGGSAAINSNAALVDVMRSALAETNLPVDAISTVDPWGREGAAALMRARGYVDVLIPRGGAGLIEECVRSSQVPVIETGTGNCHLYVDASADLDDACAIAVNAKTQRVGVCNAIETLLLDRATAQTAWEAIVPALAERGVKFHVGPQAREILNLAGYEWVDGDETDFATEYLSLDIAVEVVDGVDEAIGHIRRYSSGHTEAIVAQDATAISRFVRGVDAAALAVNASTRFTDGGQLGLGAEIGISTQKLHARGPMGVHALTSTTWILTGTGHIRP
ncbi:glutamate-5-semialdehyde dehydrogenase [Nanchangia anserum]|uniref:Gamma-glutamyl phosphate reductase n=1 Tax=Nanchangia anserum TaxID=2692125 RepID=A0A8I0GG38_9ACTO|nr:glutamate-5-semialdehyde dehydrogenase [Nanchangia anserum]MBD3690192.1 glutamate-5-semialdehyde dehydrogenase [Nanchangia anserum]QOX82587.1 glutamate-5-semialdehyde dehydrogenase [Nanchangia anserum]